MLQQRLTVPRLPADLKWTRATAEHLAAHEISVGDARAVFANAPLFFEQDSVPELTNAGFYQMRPRRLQMLGPDDQERVLMVILELPDHEGLSKIVTGWIAQKDEVDIYELGT